MKRIVAAAFVLALIAGACGSDGGHSEHAGNDEAPSSNEGSVPGEAASADEADREVTVLASDKLRFDPTSVEVSAGEVITFVVTNEGQIDHEFVLGDEAYQEAHGEDMAGHEMSESDNAVTVAPGQTAELTWRFESSGEVLYGCHEPGHYDGGMVGTVAVS